MRAALHDGDDPGRAAVPGDEGPKGSVERRISAFLGTPNGPPPTGAPVGVTASATPLARSTVVATATNSSTDLLIFTTFL